MVAVVALGGVLALAACGDSEPVVKGRDDSEPAVALGEQLPFHIFPPNVAAAGSDLIALEATRVFEGPEEFNVVDHDIRAASRSVDGQWHELPPVPFRGVAALATAGDTVVAGGLECASPECVSGRVKIFILRPDRSGWNRVDVPATEALTESAEIDASLSPSNYAILTGGGPTQYWIGPDGTAYARSLRRDLGGDRTFGCVMDGSIVLMAARGSATGSAPDVFTSYEMIGDVQIQDNVPPDFGNRRVGAAVPAGVTTRDATICGAGLVTVFDRSTQGTYSLQSDSWELGPSNFVELGGDPSFRSTPGRFAVAPDGQTVYAVANDARVLRRVGNQPWEDTGQVAGMIYASDAQVIGFNITGYNALDRTTVELWPT